MTLAPWHSTFGNAVMHVTQTVKRPGTLTVRLVTGNIIEFSHGHGSVGKTGFDSVQEWLTVLCVLCSDTGWTCDLSTISSLECAHTMAPYWVRLRNHLMASDLCVLCVLCVVGLFSADDFSSNQGWIQWLFNDFSSPSYSTRSMHSMRWWFIFL